MVQGVEILALRGDIKPIGGRISGYFLGAAIVKTAAPEPALLENFFHPSF